MPSSGPRAAFAAAPTPVPNHDVLATGVEAASGVTLVKEEEAEETLGQQRDRLALALVHGPVRVDSHIKVEDSTSGEDTDGDGAEEEEVGPGGDGGSREGEEGLGEEGGWCCSRGRPRPVPAPPPRPRPRPSPPHSCCPRP